MYPVFIWENFQPMEEEYTSNETWEQEYEEDNYEDPPLGTLLEEDALEVIRLTNQERENYRLEPLEIDTRQIICILLYYHKGAIQIGKTKIYRF